MKNEESHNEAQRRHLLSRLWSLWSSWMFAPEAKPPPEPPKPDAPKFGEEFESYKRLSDQRKAFHDETSKTIRRVFYTLVGTCLFCVITLSGSPDAQLLTPEATVTLPVLNYKMGFQAFLVVGPVVLIALTIYLHIFVGHLRMTVVASGSRQPMLPNFSSWSARLVVLVIFYWMVPITLAVFTWKAWPRPYGPLLGYVTLGVTAGLVLLQIRRCPREWRWWGLPLLVAAFAIFYQLMFSVTDARQLNLFKADLSEKDLRFAKLSYAFLAEADLSGANLSRANLSEADLSEADLSEAKLSGADLSGADLSGAIIVQGQLEQACGDEFTNLPEGLIINPCPKDQQDADDISLQERKGSPPGQK